MLVDRWMHGRWNPVPVPAGLTGAAVFAAAASPQGDVWAVGAQYLHPDDAHLFLLHRTLHNEWRVYRSPCYPPDSYPADSDCVLLGVAAASSHDAWAVGHDDQRVVLLHWDGAGWTRVKPSPSTPPGSTLTGVTAVPGKPGHWWAVGFRLRGLVLRLG